MKTSNCLFKLQSFSKGPDSLAAHYLPPAIYTLLLSSHKINKKLKQLVICI